MPEFRFRRRKNKGSEQAPERQDTPPTGRANGPLGDPPLPPQGTGGPSGVLQADNPVASGTQQLATGRRNEGQMSAESSVSEDYCTITEH